MPKNLITSAGWKWGAVPIAAAAAAVSALTSSPYMHSLSASTRRITGAKLLIEGLTKDESLEGKRVAVIEDVTTTGGSAMKAVEAAKDAGAEVALVFTMVDRRRAPPRPSRRPGSSSPRYSQPDEFLRIS